MATLDASRAASQPGLLQELPTSNARMEAKRHAIKVLEQRKVLVGKADDIHKHCVYKAVLVLQ
jgi:hypothetical protein